MTTRGVLPAAPTVVPGALPGGLPLPITGPTLSPSVTPVTTPVPGTTTPLPTSGTTVPLPTPGTAVPLSAPGTAVPIPGTLPLQTTPVPIPLPITQPGGVGAPGVAPLPGQTPAAGCQRIATATGVPLIANPGGTAITLRWLDRPDATHYAVSRAEIGAGGVGPWTQIAMVVNAAPSTGPTLGSASSPLCTASVGDSGLRHSMIYGYRVDALQMKVLGRTFYQTTKLPPKGASFQTLESEQSRYATPDVPPPTNLLAIYAQPNVSLSWTPLPGGASQYDVERDGVSIVSLPQAAYTDQLAAPGPHTYAVRAHYPDAGGDNVTPFGAPAMVSVPRVSGYGLGMTPTVTVASDEPCTISQNPNPFAAGLLLPADYKLVPAAFIDASANGTTAAGTKPLASVPAPEPNGRVHPFLRREAHFAAAPPAQGAPPAALQVLGDAVAIALQQTPLVQGPLPAASPADTSAAVAQLAVTGRRAFCSFASVHPATGPASSCPTPIGPNSGPQDADLLNVVLNTYPAVRSLSSTGVSAAVKSVLDNAYAALWAIRANDPNWRFARPSLGSSSSLGSQGWIAVSGEDDTPHRPVNVYTAPYPQFDLPVTVSNADFGTPSNLSGLLAQPVTLVARYMVATSGTFIGIDPLPSCMSHPATAPGLPAPPRTLPPEGLPTIQGKIILYIHGGGSRAEEAVPMANNLICQGLALTPALPLTVISLDLPDSAYSQSFDPQIVVGATSSGGLGLPYKALTAFPVVNFEEAYLRDFVNALEAKLPGQIKNNIIAVMGGSLGGNLSLKLASKSQAFPYLRNIVAWSPTAMVKTDDVRKAVVQSGVIGNFKAPNWGAEADATRALYFDKLYNQWINELLGLPPNPQMWYRGQFPWTSASGLPCKPSFINQSRFDRYEIYSANIRNWTTALDTEQATYDFHAADPAIPNATVPQYLTMNTRMLLATGAEDRFYADPNSVSMATSVGAAAVPALVSAAAPLAGTAFTGPLGAGIFSTAGAFLGPLLPLAPLAPGVFVSLNNEDIFGYTHDVANMMSNTPGRTLFINRTGHSIHDERPAFFSAEILDFLTTPDLNLQIDLTTGKDDARWNSTVAALLNVKPASGTLSIPSVINDQFGQPGAFFVPYVLNQWVHPFNPNPPAIDNPCGICYPLSFFQLPGNSQTSFTVGLSRFRVNGRPMVPPDVASFQIHFAGGTGSPTDSAPDSWTLSGVSVTQRSPVVGSLVDGTASLPKTLGPGSGDWLFQMP